MHTYSGNEYVYMELLAALTLLKMGGTAVSNYKTFRGEAKWSRKAAKACLSKTTPIT